MTEFLESLNDDLRGDIEKAGFKDVNGLAKSFLDTHKMVQQRVAIPGEMATAEELGKFYNKVGRPEEAKGYELKNPEGYADEAAETAFREKAFVAGLSKKQAAEMYSHITSTSMEAFEASATASQGVKEAAEAQLREVWGSDYDKNMATSAGAIDLFFDEKSTDAVKELAASNPGVAAALARIGSAIGEDSNSGNKGSSNMNMTKDEAWKAIKEQQHDPKSAYRDRSHIGHAEAVEEVQKLFQMVTEDGED